MKYKGFYIPIGWKDGFIITSRKNKTARLVSDIIKVFGGTPTPETIKSVSRRLRPAVLEVKETSAGRKYNDIYGAGFDGCGHFIDENRDIIIELN